MLLSMSFKTTLWTEFVVLSQKPFLALFSEVANTKTDEMVSLHHSSSYKAVPSMQVGYPGKYTYLSNKMYSDVIN